MQPTFPPEGSGNTAPVIIVTPTDAQNTSPSTSGLEGVKLKEPSIETLSKIPKIPADLSSGQGSEDSAGVIVIDND